jgi:hypothetical protein
MAMRAWLQGKNNRLPLVLALAACTLLPARARLGESEAESIARYGPATGTYNAGTPDYFYRTLTFQHAGFSITEEFIGSTCELICFQKPDGSALDEGTLDLLLRSESAGRAWARSDLLSTDLLWTRPDGAQARYDTARHAFAVCSAVYLQAEAQRKRLDQAHQLDNL